jgi:hypothetical protein
MVQEREEDKKRHGLQARMVKRRRVRSSIRNRAQTMSESVNDSKMREMQS